MYGSRMDKLGKSWYFFLCLFLTYPSTAGDTFFKFSYVLFFKQLVLYHQLARRLHLRQRLTEEQFSQALEEKDAEQHMRKRFEGLTIDENSEDGYPITVRARDLDKDELFEVKT